MGLYVHIPFCATKCDYCDFTSFAGREAQWKMYLEALLQEIAAHRPATAEADIDTVYIGGGTPTVWSAAFLRTLLEALGPFPAGAEVTCEANPGTLSPKKLAALRSCGVNRLSLGLQAWQPELLAAIGRSSASGQAQAFAENFAQARAAGFANISVDVMFALPGQTLAHWEETLAQVTALGPEHISAYALTPEEGTPLWGRLPKGFLEEVEALDRSLYHHCVAFLQAHGYRQYEISNFCRPGFESRHNLGYWRRRPYLGFGLGAHSFVNGQRFHNTQDLQKYLAADCREGFAEITQADAMAETMFLGLRLSAGVPVADFRRQFSLRPQDVYGPWLAQMEAAGLLHATDDCVYLSPRGLDLANQVMMGFV